MNNISFEVIGNIEIVTGSGMHEFPYHTHNSFMVGAVLDGSGEFCIGGKSWRLSKNDVYAVPCDVGISIEPSDGFSYVTVCIKHELAEVMRKYSVSEYCYFGMYDELHDLLKALRSRTLDENGFVQRTVCLLKLAETGNAPGERSACIAEAAGYIDRRCEGRFDLQGISEKVFLSKYYLIRKFRYEMGITPQQYYQQCRVRRIKQLAQRYSQAEIAYLLGFSSQSHMSSVFARYMGITLGEYKKSIRRE